MTSVQSPSNLTSNLATVSMETQENDVLEEWGITSETTQNWQVSALLLVAIAGVTGNVLVCAAVAIDRKLHSVANYFLVSLAVTDLCVCLLVMPCSILQEFLGYWPLGLALCNVWQILDVALCTSSIMHMCTISLDRYMTLRRPLTRRPGHSRRALPLRICIVWTASLAIASPTIYLGVHRPLDILSPDLKCVVTNPYFVIYGSLAAFFCPLMLMLVTHSLTIHLLKKQDRRVSKHGEDGGLRRIVVKRPKSREEPKLLGSTRQSIVNADNLLLEVKRNEMMEKIEEVDTMEEEVMSQDEAENQCKEILSNFQFSEGPEIAENQNCKNKNLKETRSECENCSNNIQKLTSNSNTSPDSTGKIVNCGVDGCVTISNIQEGCHTNPCELKCFSKSKSADKLERFAESSLTDAEDKNNTLQSPYNNINSCGKCHLVYYMPGVYGDDGKNQCEALSVRPERTNATNLSGINNEIIEANNGVLMHNDSNSQNKCKSCTRVDLRNNIKLCDCTERFNCVEPTMQCNPQNSTTNGQNMQNHLELNHSMSQTPKLVSSNASTKDLKFQICEICGVTICTYCKRPCNESEENCNSLNSVQNGLNSSSKIIYYPFESDNYVNNCMRSNIENEKLKTECKCQNNSSGNSKFNTAVCTKCERISNNHSSSNLRSSNLNNESSTARDKLTNGFSYPDEIGSEIQDRAPNTSNPRTLTSNNVNSCGRDLNGGKTIVLSNASNNNIRQNSTSNNSIRQNSTSSRRSNNSGGFFSGWFGSSDSAHSRGSTDTRRSRASRLLSTAQSIASRTSDTVQMRNVRTERKAVRVLSTMFMSFVACWALFFTLNLIQGACPTCHVRPLVMEFALWLGYVSSMVNPIIYTVFNRTFRTSITSLITCRACGVTSRCHGNQGECCRGDKRGR